MANTAEVFEDYNRIEVAPISGSLGAEVHGVDLSQPLDDETFAEVRRAFLEHLVIFFRDQKLDPASQAAFAERFGELNRHPYVKGLEEHPDVFAIVKEPEDTHHFGNGWHTDLSYAERPAFGSILYGLEIPPYGGDTKFANMYLAYETLSDGMKEMLSRLNVLNSTERTYGPQAKRFQAGAKTMKVQQLEEVVPVAHPMVRTHPETGRKCLFMNELHSVGIEGLTREESQPILDYLVKHATREEFTCRFRWRKGSAAFWDNRCTMHYAVDDFAGMRRVMHRVTIEGDKPV